MRLKASNISAQGNAHSWSEDCNYVIPSEMREIRIIKTVCLIRIDEESTE